MGAVATSKGSGGGVDGGAREREIARERDARVGAAP